MKLPLEGQPMYTRLKRAHEILENHVYLVGANDHWFIATGNVVTHEEIEGLSALWDLGEEGIEESRPVFDPSMMGVNEETEEERNERYDKAEEQYFEENAGEAGDSSNVPIEEDPDCQDED